MNNLAGVTVTILITGIAWLTYQLLSAPQGYEDQTGYRTTQACPEKRRRFLAWVIMLAAFVLALAFWYAWLG